MKCDTCNKELKEELREFVICPTCNKITCFDCLNEEKEIKNV